MSRLKLIDRIALSAMLLSAAAIPLAASAFGLPHEGASGAARAPVLTDDVFQQIRPGMAARDVLELIGPPSSKTRFARTHTTAWEYNYRDTWGYTSEFSVMVDDRGIVASKFSMREGD